MFLSHHLAYFPHHLTYFPHHLTYFEEWGKCSLVIGCLRTGDASFVRFKRSDWLKKCLLATPTRRYMCMYMYTKMKMKMFTSVLV